MVASESPSVVHSQAPSQYRVVTELGVGGSARVFLAVLDRGESFRKLVVLKTLRSQFSDNPCTADMFRMEAEIAARLHHPNVVEVYEVIEDDGQPIIVMEYLRGANLRELLYRPKKDDPTLPLRHHIEILREVGDALHYCHELRDFDGTSMALVHRDISPHNVYVTFQGGVRLLDFGIAKVVGVDGDTATGFTKGKIRYMAPEQMLGKDLDRRADIYALGVMLWEAIRGREMWHKIPDTVLMQRTVDGDLPQVEPLPGVPPKLVEVTDRCLAFHAADRYDDAHTVARELAQALREVSLCEMPLGSFVEARFGARDRKITKLVRNKITKGVQPSRADGVAAIDWTDATSVPFSQSGSGSGPGLGAKRQPAEDAHPSKPYASTLLLASSGDPRHGNPLWSRVAPVVLVAVVALVIGWVLRAPGSMSARAGAESAPSPASTPAAKPPPETASDPAAGSTVAVGTHSDLPTEPQDVRIRLAVDPPGAMLSLDGEALGSNPFEGTLPSDEKLHVLSAEAEGYVTAERSFRLGEDVNETLVLTKQPAAELPAVASPPRARRDTKKSNKRPPPGKVPSVPDCDPPFYVDAHGVKHFKRECL